MNLIPVSRTLALKATLTEKFKNRVFVTWFGLEQPKTLRYDTTKNLPFLIDGIQTHELSIFYKYLINITSVPHSSDIENCPACLINRALENDENDEGIEHAIHRAVDTELETSRAPLPNERMPRRMGVIELLLEPEKNFTLPGTNIKIYYSNSEIKSPFMVGYYDERKETLQGFWEWESWIPINTHKRKKVSKYKIKDELGIYTIMGTLQWVQGLNIVETL